MLGRRFCTRFGFASGLASSSRLSGQRRTQSSTAQVAASGAAPEVLSVEKVWALWNEGNLFSMNLAQLHAFLRSQSVGFDANSKKAALIRQVEELLQSRDQQQKGGAAAPQQGGGGYGRMQQGGAGAPQETLMDLKQSGFYESPLAMAPKAFQLLVANNTCDLVVARVNTTSFPGFPSSTECYTLTSAVGELALRARYSKALQWCVMNMANLSLPPGEFVADFGKIVFKPEIIRKKRNVVSSWTLQQRAQLGEPFTWVSTASQSVLLESFLQAEGFVPAKVRGPQKYFDCHVRRGGRNDVICLEMDSTGKAISGAMPWYPLQSAHIVHKAGGQDTRLQLRTRLPLSQQEVNAVRNMKILNITEEQVTSALAPEMGQVTYTSENDVAAWERKGANGVVFTLKKITRTPLIITNESDNDPRIEYQITTPIPQCDLNAFANDFYDLSARLAEALTPAFLEEFSTGVEPLSLDKE